MTSVLAILIYTCIVVWFFKAVHWAVRTYDDWQYNRRLARVRQVLKHAEYTSRYRMARKVRYSLVRRRPLSPLVASTQERRRRICLNILAEIEGRACTL